MKNNGASPSEAEKKRKTPSKVLRITLGALFAAIALWNCLPLSFGVIHPGMMLIFAACAAGILVCVFYEKLKKLNNSTAGWKALITALKIIAVFGVSVFVILSVMMTGGALRTVSEDKATEATVIVPGAQINGDSVSLMLSRRLDTAGEFLAAHPQAKCVVSGGKGDNESYTEASVMKRYLAEKHGIDESRIFTEEGSSNTRENMLYSAEVIKKNSLSGTVVIATDFFHAYRCEYEARSQGLSAYAAPCVTDWFLFPGYWVRECLAICKAVFL